MNKFQVAIIWGYDREEIQWSCHHHYWEVSLRERDNIEVYRYNWDNWQTMPTGFDLYLFIDFNKSLFRVHDKSYHPRVFFWWDHFHHSYVYTAQIIQYFDCSYLAEYHAVKELNNLGISKVKWLPPAYYPWLYRPLNLSKLHKFAFIGQPDDTLITKGYTRKEFFTKLSSEPYMNSYIGQGVYGEEVNKVYNESMVLIDRTIYCNIGTRIFETIGSGGFLLVNRGPIPSGIDELAFDGQHFISYDDSYEDCLDKLKYYIKHEEERQKIARNGEAYFRQHHTYHHRIDVIFKDLGLI